MNGHGLFYLPCQAVQKHQSSKLSGGMGNIWRNSGIAIESP